MNNLGNQCQDWCLAFLFNPRTKAIRSIFPPWKPTPVLDQAAQVFDLAGVAGVAVDDAGEPDA